MKNIPASKQEKWQIEGNYSIEDLHNRGYVFVPSTPSCWCNLFRAQHQATNPSHALVHVEGEKCMLVPLRPMKMGEEVTFDYFAGDTHLGGYQRTQIQWDAMAERLSKKGDKDCHPRSGFYTTRESDEESSFAFAQKH